MRKAVRKLTDDPAVLRIMDQLELQGKTGKELENHLGLANGTYTSWKYRNVKSYRNRIDEIAEFLGVSKGYLIEGIDEYVDANTLTGTEIKMIKIFRSMGNEQQKNYLKTGEFLVMSTKYERMDAIISHE